MTSYLTEIEKIFQKFTQKPKRCANDQFKLWREKKNDVKQNLKYASSQKKYVSKTK